MPGLAVFLSGRRVLVATKDDSFAPAAYVDINTGQIVSDVRPLGVWSKFAINVEEPPVDFVVTPEMLENLEAGRTGIFWESKKE